MVPIRERVWCCRLLNLQGFMDMVSGLTLTPEVRQNLEGVPLKRKRLLVSGDTGIIQIRGLLMDSVPWWMSLIRYDATGYDEIQRMCVEAVERDDIKHIRLDIESQGGMMSGSIECAETLCALGGRKQSMEARITNLCASGAYLLASQASRITCNQTALVGSLGVYMTVADSFVMHENAGVKINVVKSGEHKGRGVTGSKVTDRHIEDLQRNVNSLADIFINHVASGRGVASSRIRELSTGALWVGQEAKHRRLVDEVRDAGKEVSFMDKAQSMSVKQGITLKEAMSQLAKQDPEEYAEHKVEKRFSK